MKSHHLFLAASVFVAPYLPEGFGVTVALLLLIPGIALFVIECAKS